MGGESNCNGVNLIKSLRRVDFVLFTRQQLHALNIYTWGKAGLVAGLLLDGSIGRVVGGGRIRGASCR